MIYRLKRAYVWLRRFTHLGGNGIQSPFAYSFACGVINNKSAYYAYTDLRKQLRSLSLRRRKLAKLLFRLANYTQPTTILIDEEVASRYATFLKRGCLKAQLVTISTNSPKCNATSYERPVMIVTRSLDMVPTALSDGDMVVALDIRRSATSRKQWKALVANHTATQTFDLYNYGIAMVATQRYKQHYIINF